MIPIIHEIIARLAIPTASKKLGLVSAKTIRQTNIANRNIQGMSIWKKKYFLCPNIVKKKSLTDNGRLAAIVKMTHNARNLNFILSHLILHTKISQNFNNLFVNSIALRTIDLFDYFQTIKLSSAIWAISRCKKKRKGLDIFLLEHAQLLFTSNFVGENFVIAYLEKARRVKPLKNGDGI